MRFLDQFGRWFFTKTNPAWVKIASDGDGNALHTQEAAYRFVDKLEDGRDGVGSFMIMAGQEVSFPVNNLPVNFRNMGTNNVFYGPLSGKMDNNWVVMAGGRSGPITADTNLYFYSESDARVYYAFMEV